MTYGNLGVVIGHEIVHGFDVNGNYIIACQHGERNEPFSPPHFLVVGRRYDRYGNMTIWWTESLMREFNQRADCFVQQYSNFVIDHIKKPVRIKFFIYLFFNYL